MSVHILEIVLFLDTLFLQISYGLLSFFVETFQREGMRAVLVLHLHCWAISLAICRISRPFPGKGAWRNIYWELIGSQALFSVYECFKSQIPKNNPVKSTFLLLWFVDRGGNMDHKHTRAIYQPVVYVAEWGLSLCMSHRDFHINCDLEKPVIKDCVCVDWFLFGHLVLSIVFYLYQTSLSTLTLFLLTLILIKYIPHWIFLFCTNDKKGKSTEDYTPSPTDLRMQAADILGPCTKMVRQVKRLPNCSVSYGWILRNITGLEDLWEMITTNPCLKSR